MDGPTVAALVDVDAEFAQFGGDGGDAVGFFDAQA